MGGVMSEDELKSLLSQLRIQPNIGFSGDGFRFYGNPAIPVEADVSPEMRAMNPQFARFIRSLDLGNGSVGFSYGNDPEGKGARISYENQLKALGGLLGLSGEIGEKNKKASISYKSENVPFRAQASMTQDEFGNLIRALEAQYVKQISDNMAIGLGGGRINDMQMLNMQLRGRF
jgi:hypothetical protein